MESSFAVGQFAIEPPGKRNIDVVKIAKKKGSRTAPLFRDTRAAFRLERISPVEKYVHPVAAKAGPAIGDSGSADPMTETQVHPRLVVVVA